ncbi:hypothetical protein ACJJTC_014866 [Scirpophaga incertulas]
MRGDTTMIRTVFALSLCGIVQSSVEHGASIAPIFAAAAAAVPVPPPVVTSASSQYFQRTFNRLVTAPVLEPVLPIPPPQPVFHITQPQSVVPIAPAPPVLVQPSPSSIPIVPTSNEPIQPNIAIAVATAHAAPVATILLPPYPFAPPPTIDFIPATPSVSPDESRKESTTRATTKFQVTTTTKQAETTTPLPLASNSDNNFLQTLPSDQNVNFKLYGPPQQQWNNQKKPLKLRTSVEIVPVPLAYIAPPPLPKLEPIKTVKHIHSFVPTRAKIIIRPVRISSLPVKIRTVRVPARLLYRAPITDRMGVAGNRPELREIEPITFRPGFRPITKPPKL